MLRRAEHTLSLTQSMYRQGFVTRMSLEADRYAAEQAKIELEKAETKLNVLSTTRARNASSSWRATWRWRRRASSGGGMSMA